MEKPLDQSLSSSHFVWIALFSVFMGILEAIVVVYLRELYFPDGFHFPLRSLPERMLRVEILREICTRVMIAAVAALSARTFTLRFSLFLFIFGVWDIVYYLFLKVLLDWPPSVFTWDVLFLIPVTWIGPVLAPLICSLTMIALGLGIRFLHSRLGTGRFGKIPCFLLLTGALIIFLSFTWDYASFMISRVSEKGSSLLLREIAAFYVPEKFPWSIFLLGESLVLASGWTLFRAAGKSARSGGPPGKSDRR